MLPEYLNTFKYAKKIYSYREVINYLLYKWGRTYEQFIKNEADRDFVFVPPKTYGPPPVPAPLPYDSYYPKDHNGYLPPVANSSGGDKQYVDSYYR